MYEYEKMALTKEDFSKRKRVKNCIPELNRCNALRGNGEQCTRKKKEGCEYCGTHVKGTPHGLINSTECSETISQKVEVFAEEIFGIVYYIDKFNNVYKTEDIVEGKQNPQIIAKYVKNNNRYTIPGLGLE
jgi:hypothetical protein